MFRSFRLGKELQKRPSLTMSFLAGDSYSERRKECTRKQEQFFHGKRNKEEH